MRGGLHDCHGLHRGLLHIQPQHRPGDVQRIEGKKQDGGLVVVITSVSSSNVLIHIHRLLLFQKINMYLISVYLLLLTVNSFLRPTRIEKYFCEKTSDVQIIYLVYINNW